MRIILGHNSEVPKVVDMANTDSVVELLNPEMVVIEKLRDTV